MPQRIEAADIVFHSELGELARVPSQTIGIGIAGSMRHLPSSLVIGLPELHGIGKALCHAGDVPLRRYASVGPRVVCDLRGLRHRVDLIGERLWQRWLAIIDTRLQRIDFSPRLIADLTIDADPTCSLEGSNPGFGDGAEIAIGNQYAELLLQLGYVWSLIALLQHGPSVGVGRHWRQRSRRFNFCASDRFS